jgi:hypothetical protein
MTGIQCFDGDGEDQRRYLLKLHKESPRGVIQKSWVCGVDARGRYATVLDTDGWIRRKYAMIFEGIEAVLKAEKRLNKFDWVVERIEYSVDSDTSVAKDEA